MKFLYELSKGDQFTANGQTYTKLDTGKNMANGSIGVRRPNPDLTQGGFVFERFARNAIVEALALVTAFVFTGCASTPHCKPACPADQACVFSWTENSGVFGFPWNASYGPPICKRRCANETDTDCARGNQ